MKALGIAIDGGRYVRIVLPAGSPPQTLHMRTLEAGQDSARLDFYTFKDGRPVPVAHRRISGLRRASTSHLPSNFSLRVEHSSKHLWRLSVRQKDKTHDNCTVRTGRSWWPLVALLALAVVVVLFRLLPPFQTLSGSHTFFRSSVPVGRIEHTTNDTVHHGSPDSADSTVSDGDGAGSVDPRADDSRRGGDSSARSPSNIDEPAVKSTGPKLSDKTDPVADVDRNVDITADGPIDQSAPVQESLEISPVYFLPDSAVLSPAAREQLRQLSQRLSSGDKLEISGHCAEFGSERGQKALSLARAEVVADFLKSQLPSLSIGSVQGYGVSRPVTRDPAKQNLNRRVEIQWLGRETG